MNFYLFFKLKKFKRLLTILCALGAYVLISFLLARQYSALEDHRTVRWEARGGFLYRNGVKYLIKGIGWDPTRPGELPWKRNGSQQVIDDDFARIRKAGFNTIRTWELVTPDVIAAAERHGLTILMGIWIERDGAFDNPVFRAQQLAKVTKTVRMARDSGAVLGYLVMNEPKAEHVLKEGLDTTRAFLRELARTVHREDPQALVGISSWPGLEFMDEPSLDLVAANLYAFRPKALLETVGYEGMVRLWKEKIAGERPFIVSEYGVSVAPTPPKLDGPGGATEEDQAKILPRLAEDALRGGAAGGAVFQWLDSWWKNKRSRTEEFVHDASDPEEWFGLYAFDANPKDRGGQARPALEAMRKFNRVVLTQPVDGPVAARETEVEAYVEEGVPVAVQVSINGGEAVVVPCVREGPWVRGRIGLAAQIHGPQRLAFLLSGPKRETLGRFMRVVLPPGEAPKLALRIIASGARRTAVAQLTDPQGGPLAGKELRFSSTEAYRRTDKFARVMTDRSGAARFEFELPASPAAVMVVAAFRPIDDEPPLAYDMAILTQENR